MNKPAGYFQFEFNGQVIKGRLCLWSMELFGKKCGIANLDELLSLFGGMSLKTLSELLLCCVEYMCVKEKVPFEYTELDAYDWIESVGVGNLVEIVQQALDLPKPESKKKKAHP